MTRRIANIALLITALVGTTATALAFTVDDAYDFRGQDGSRSWGRLDYINARRADIVYGAQDSPRDNTCTVLSAQVMGYVRGQYVQIGNIIPLGSVCGGRGASFPVKSITTTQYDIFEIRVWAQRGAGGPYATDLAICRPGTEYENCR